MDSEKIKEARRYARMVLSGENKYSLSSLQSIKQLCIDCNFSVGIINGIDTRINETKESLNNCLKGVQILIKKGLKENNIIICKKCKDLKGCRVSVLRINEASIRIFCGQQEICIKPNEFRFFKSAQITP